MKPDNSKINRNTGVLVYELTKSHEGIPEPAVAVGFKLRRAIRAALRATVPGGQTDAQIEELTDKAQQSFNRYLTRIR